MKSAKNLRLVLTVTLAAAALAWIPPQKGTRKMRMADAAPVATAALQA